MIRRSLGLFGGRGKRGAFRVFTEFKDLGASENETAVAVHAKNRVSTVGQNLVITQPRLVQLHLESLA